MNSQDFSEEDMNELCKYTEYSDSWLIGENRPKVKNDVLDLYKNQNKDIELFFKEVRRISIEGPGSRIFYEFLNGVSPIFRDIPMRLSLSRGLTKSILECRLRLGK